MAWDGSTRRSRLPKDWRIIRARILERDGHRCTWIEPSGHPGILGTRCIAVATDVDHRIAGDNHNDDNLQALCRPHHFKKTQAEAQAARWKYRAKREPERHPGLKH